MNRINKWFKSMNKSVISQGSMRPDCAQWWVWDMISMN